MDINGKIQTYLKKRKKLKRSLPFHAILSLLVTICVVSNLIMPAISMSIENTLSSIVSVDTEKKTATPGTPSVLEGTTMLDIASADIWCVTMESNNTYFYEATQAGATNTSGLEVAKDPVDIGVFIEYNFDQNVKQFLTDAGSGPHLGWNLGNTALNTNNFVGDIYDPNYPTDSPGSTKAGTYVIENGYVKITLTPEYIAYVTSGAGSLEGALDFSGTLSRSETDDGDQSFTMAGQTVIVDFPDKYAKITNKSANVQDDGTVKWTVTINNDRGADLKDYVLTDTMLNGASNLTLSPALGYTQDGNSLKITDSSTSQWLTITYTTPIDKAQIEAGSQKNTATLQKGDDSKSVSTGESTAQFNKTPLTVNKTGTPDYMNGNPHSDKINWTVTVTNNYGLSLNEYIIEDPMIPDAGSVTLTPSGTLTALDGDKYRITLNEPSKTVTLNYSATAVAGSNSNTATAYYPDNTAPSKGGNSESENINYLEEKALYTLSKGHTTNTDGTITWTLQVYNQYNQNLEGYTLSDQMLGSAVSVEINPSNAATHSGDTITMTSSAKDTQWITVTYKTKITDDQLQNDPNTRNNTVTLKDKDGNEITKDDETASFNQNTNFTVVKSAKADYESGAHNGKITWTLKITSNYGTSLDGYLIEDAKLTEGATVSPSGTLMPKDGKWELSGTNGAKTVTITYQTEATQGTDNSNNATLYYPDGTGTGDGGSDGETIYYKGENELISLGKSGYYDQDKHQITWTVNINVQGGLSLSGYQVTDDQFPDDVSGITFSPAAAGTGATLTTNDNGDKVLTFGDSIPTGSVTLTYTKAVDVSSVTENYTATNDVGIGHGDFSTTTTGTANVTVRNTLNKYSNNGNVYYITNNGIVTKTVSWTADLVLDNSFSGKVYEDTLTVDSGNGTHTITDAQLAAIKVYGRVQQYGGDTLLVLDTDYTVERTTNGFKITFKDTLDAAGYNFVKICYDTTMTANAPTSTEGYPYTYVYDNTASFNGNTDNDNDYSITRNNPESYESLDLTLNKTWNPGPEKPASVTAKILYKTNQDDTWRYLHIADGKAVYYEDSTYGSASEYIVTLNEAGGWAQTVTGLHRAITKADANGNSLPTVYYYYKIEEITPEGTAVESGLYETEGGYYKVTYNNNNGVNYTTAIGIANEFKANTSVTPEKLWDGDTGTGNGFDSVTVQLEFSTDWGGTRYPVKIDANGEYIFDTTGTAAGTIVTQEITKGEDGKWIGTTWADLPSIIVVNGSAVACQYTIKEISVKQTAAAEGETGTEIVINNNKFITADGYYTVSNSASGTGNLTVKNTFTKTVNYAINVVKGWEGDVNNSDSRPEVILVQLQRSENWDNYWTNYGDPVAISADSSWSTAFTGLPNQLVAEDGTVTTYRYRVIEAGYKKTADSEAVMLPENAYSFATDENGVYNISYTNSVNPYSGNSEMSQAGTATIKNTFTPVTTIDLTPQKKWTGDTNVVSTDRPKSITFTLQYREGWGGTWKNVEENGQAVTVTLTDDANTTTESEWVWNNSTYQNEEVVITFWNGTTLTGLPSEKITINSDGSYTKSTLYYRFVETAYVSADNISTNIDPSIYATSSTKDDNFKTGNGKYDITYNDTYMTGTLTVTNNFTAAVGIEKFAVDKNGNELDSTMEIEDLANHKYTIDGEDYYVFNWMIKYDLTNYGNGDKLPTLRDQLPDGFELLYDNSFVGETKDWAGKYSNQWWEAAGGSFTKVLNDKYHSEYVLHPFIVYPENGWGAGAQPAESAEAIFEKYMHVVNFDNPDFWYYYDESTNEVYFNKYKATAPAMVYYAIKIKCSELDAKIAKGSYTISNTAYTYDDSSATEEGRVPILDTTGSIKIFNPVDTNLITKSYSETKIPGNIQYSLNINPEGKNLSSGDTIDIQDLFETVSYFDHDYAGGQLTSGKKLVDVLMNNIKLYKVDANGNKIELTSSEYTLMFQSGTEVADGAALMKLTIPDETHIVVDYTYKLIANETTPSVIHGCKSSTRVNGRYVTMAPGLVPPAGDKITFSNTASLISDSAESSDSETNTEYEVFKSSGTITTNALPSIKKVNTGDYSINNLSATFLLARYENGRWYFVDSATLTNADKNEYDITWGNIGSDGTRISSDATTIDIVNGTDFKIPLDENMLYKLIEIVVPNGYEGSNLGLTDEQFEEMIRAYLNDGATHYNDKDYTVFLNHYISTHYFTYNSTVSSYPSGVAAGDVIQVKSGSDVEIPNNKLIDLGVEKEWINPTTDTTDSQITVELYWSYTKDTNGIPSDAVLAKAEDLGILDENFTAVKTITVGDAANKKLWEDLPNGTNRKPIYYYIKETAYTIGGKTYTLDTESNTYKAETGEPGAYFPTYSGNAANDDAIIGVKNSHQLMLKKEWKNASNVPMKNIPVNGVVVSIYGIDMDGAQTTEPIFEGVELSVANNWTADLTSLLGTTDLSLYKAFVAVENENPDLAGYVVSCVFNLNAQTGEIIVTNKNTAATDASVTVNKIWSDGADLHANESITATLYQSQTEITDLTGLSAKLPLVGATVMQPVDENDTQSYEVTLNAENNWTYSWTGLPLEDEDQNKYYYYVLETMSDVANADKYTVTYVVTDKTPTKTEYTVKNYRNAIVVEKEWLAEDGTALTKDELEELGIESITLDVLKEVATVPEDGLYVVTFGDSITDSYNKGTPYPYQMTDILEDDYGYTLIGLENNYIKKMGYSGYQIGSNSTSGLRGQVSGVPTDADVVCVLGGTNDIHQGGKWGSNTAFINPEECLNRLKAWISEIDTRVTNEDLVIIVGSIPHFDFIDASGNTTDGYGYWGNFVSDYGYESIQAAEDAANKYIDQYNALIKTYAESTSGLYFADVCAAVNKDTMLADGCHPNTTGYGEVAKTFATAINNAFSQSAEVGQITLTADNNWIGSFDIEDTDASIEYHVDESDLPAGWTVTYTNNAQKAGSSTPITVTNKKYTPTTSLQVEKIWKNDEANTSGRANISLALLRSIDGTNWEEVDVTFPAYTEGDDGAGNDMWTYSFTGLAAEDALGRQYFYKVEEDFLPGYTASYYNSSIEAVDGGNAGSLRLSNTRAISLNLEKIWSDIDENDHVGDPVTIRIYRTTDPSTLDTSNVNLILQVPTVASVGVGKTTDVYANKTPATVTSSDESIAKATFDGNKITIEGIANGTAKIAVSDGTDTIEITVTVSSLTMKLDGSTTFEMEAGETLQLSAEVSGDAEIAEIEFTENSDLISIDGNNKVTANNVGTGILITATAKLADGTIVSTSETLTVVLPSAFNITVNNAVVEETKVTIGSDVQLGIDKNYGTFTWSSSSDAIATVDASGKVTGVAAGEATITATRDNGNGTVTTDTFKVKVENGDIFENKDNVVLNLYVGDTEELTSKTILRQVSGNSNNSVADATLSNDKITVTAKAAGETTITVKGGNNWDQETTFKVIVKERFKVTPETKTLAYGDDQILTPNKEGTVEYTITSGSDLISISGNTVTAKSGKEGTATITARNTSTGETATVTIEVVAELKTITGSITDTSNSSKTYPYEYDPTLGTITFTLDGSHNCNYYFSNLQHDENLKNLVPIKYELTTSEGNSANIWGPNLGWTGFTFSGNVGIVETANNTTAFSGCDNFGIYVGWGVKPTKFVIYVKTTATASYSLKSNAVRKSTSDSEIAPLADVSNDWSQGYIEVVLQNTSDGGLQTTIENLDAYDSETGKLYYYYVEEVHDYTNYDISYSYDDGDGNSSFWINAEMPNDEGEFNVTVRNTKVESPGVELPSTGGSGTAKHYGIGLILISGSAAAYIMLKRRQRNAS